MGGKPSHLRFNVAQVLKKQEKSVEQEEQFQVQLERGSKQRGCSRGQRPVCKSLRSEVHSLRADLEAKASREAATRAKTFSVGESVLAPDLQAGLLGAQLRREAEELGQARPVNANRTEQKSPCGLVDLARQRHQWNVASSAGRQCLKSQSWKICSSLCGALVVRSRRMPFGSGWPRRNLIAKPAGSEMKNMRGGASGKVCIARSDGGRFRQGTACRLWPVCSNAVRGLVCHHLPGGSQKSCRSCCVGAVAHALPGLPSVAAPETSAVWFHLISSLG